MKLKRLILQGFKSFKDRTTVHFDEGVTGIVGPNGCGKSNIVDALFWVMGEQSAKHLRGNNMKDLIFSGSAKYNPASWAEVSLVLENDTNKHIHIGNQVFQPSEIQLTRKLYKNGETEYRINGSICRLRDIQEVFMDTGAGAKSYSIIAQGEIDRLVKAKPIERRMMIEEVAGITKFKYRKKESLRKIEQTELNLNRLRDVQSEIEKNLKLLKGQAEKAERARNLKDKIIRNELSVFSNKEYFILREMKERKEKSLIIKSSLEEWKTEKNKLEIDIEEELLERDELEATFEEKQSLLNELSKTLAAGTERLISLNKSMEDKQKFSLELAAEIEELIGSISNRKNRKEELLLELKELERVAGVDVNIEEMELEVTTLKESFDLKKTTFQSNEQKIKEYKSNIADLTTKQLENVRRVDDLSHQIENLSFDLDNLERRFSDQNEQQERIQKEINSFEGIVSELSIEVQDRVLKLEDLTDELKHKNEEYKKTFKEKVILEAELSSLKDMHENELSSQKATIKYFDNNSEVEREVLSDLLETSAEYAHIAEQVIKDKLNFIPVDKVDNSLSGYLNPENNENIGFIKEIDFDDSLEVKERLEVNGIENLKELSEVVRAKKPQYKNLVKALFHGYFIFSDDQIDKVLNLSLGINFKGLISENGKFIVRNEGGVKLFSLMERGTSLGPVERGNRISELTIKVSELTEVTKNQSEKIESLELEISNIQADLRTEESKLLTKKMELESKKKGFEALVSEFGNIEKQVLRYRENKEELSKKKLQTLQQEEESKSKIHEWDISSQALIEENRLSTEEIQKQEQEYEEKRENFLSVQMQLKTLDQQFKGMNSQLEDLEKQILREEEKSQNNKDKVAAYKEEIEQIFSEKEKLVSSNEELEENIGEREVGIADIKSALSELQDAMHEREEKIKELNNKIQKNEKILIENKVKTEKAIDEEEILARDTFEKHQVDIRKAVILALEVEPDFFDELKDISSMYTLESENGPVEVKEKDYEFKRRYGQDLQDLSRKLKAQKVELNRLGDINWQAIEEYEGQKKRYEFISNQEFELKKSLENLFSAIEQIDKKCQGRFQDAYNEVNSRFVKVFPIIFGGGAASLKVVGDINSDEAGIDIVAQPPGKKMQSINLMSGGEKALTAVSLIFSIFLVKPSPFCLLDEVDAPLDDANVGRFNELLREMSSESQFILITHNKKTMEMNDSLYGVTMQEAGVSKVVSVQLQ